MGQRASTENLRNALASVPELLHFAVHVVSPPDRPQEAALALSLEGGVPELLDAGSHSHVALARHSGRTERVLIRPRESGSERWFAGPHAGLGC